MRKSLGILVDDMSSSQLRFYMTMRLNELSKKNIECVAFFQNLSLGPVPTCFATMNVVDCFSFSGSAIATSVSTAQKLLNCPGPKRKYLYFWDLFWLRNHPKINYEYLANIFSDDRLIPIARSETHKSIIERAWNIKVPHIIDDCKFTEELTS